MAGPGDEHDSGGHDDEHRRHGREATPWVPAHRPCITLGLAARAVARGDLTRAMDRRIRPCPARAPTGASEHADEEGKGCDGGHQVEGADQFEVREWHARE